MRVITGRARGRSLETLPGGDVVRPTSQKVKEGVFSAIQFHVAGARVLDLFAGSGQMGIEALSRDAALCVFVDESREASAVSIRNLKSTGLFSSARVIVNSAERYLERAKDTFDIIFLDPPYRMGTVQRMLPLAEPVTAPGGFVVCETERECVLPETVGELTLKKSYRYGRTVVWLYRKASSVDEEAEQ